MADKSFSRSRRSTTARAVITHYAQPLEGFWRNPLLVVGEAPCLSQTGYKAYSYSPLAVITLSHIRDANWHLSRFVTKEGMTPIDLSIKTQWNAIYVTSRLGCLGGPAGANFPLLYMGTWPTFRRLLLRVQGKYRAALTLIQSSSIDLFNSGRSNSFRLV